MTSLEKMEWIEKIKNADRVSFTASTNVSSPITVDLQLCSDTIEKRAEPSPHEVEGVTVDLVPDEIRDMYMQALPQAQPLILEIMVKETQESAKKEMQEMDKIRQNILSPIEVSD